MGRSVVPFTQNHLKISSVRVITSGLIQVKFSEIIMTPDSGGAFQVVDNDGSMHTVPLHRIREMHRNGEMIWQRPPA